MSDVPLSLRPQRTDNAATETLKTQIQLLIQQRSFREISEESLKEEIRALVMDTSESEEEAEEEDDLCEQDRGKTLEELRVAKFELMQQLGQAHNEALMALDFISLLVSRDPKLKGELSMSPALKQLVPISTLDFDRWEMPTPSAAIQRKGYLVSRGHRMKSLQSSADALLRSATRLEKEVKKETEYWKEVLSITERGWSVRRVPKSRHLGVQFGFSEASSPFSARDNRGFAPLRTNPDGSIILDPELTKNPKALRVRIAQSGKTVGSSSLPSMLLTTEAKIEDLIRRARDSLFDEELFHEMSLESRSLLSYNVRLQDSTIRVPTQISYATTPPEEREILIDLVSIDENLERLENRPEDALAQKIVLLLRILLSYTHRQRLRRRSQIPPPLREQKQPPHYPLILRPLLSHFQHYSACLSIRNYLESLTTATRNAGLAIKFETSSDFDLGPAAALKHEDITDNDTLDLVIPKLFGPAPLQTMIDIVLASPNDHPISLVMKTHLYHPSFGRDNNPTLGTEYIITVPSSLFPNSASTPGTRNFVFDTASEVISHLNFLMALDIAHSIIAREHQGWSMRDSRVAEVFKDTERLGTEGRKKISLEIEGEKMIAIMRWRNKGSKDVQEKWDGVARILWDSSRQSARTSLREVVQKFTLKG